MKWNPETDDAFKTEKPSKARLSRLIGMATKPESAMNTDWQCAFSRWPPVRNRKAIQRPDFEDTHGHRDADSLLGPDNCIYFRGKAIVPRRVRRKVDFANIQSFTEHKAKETMDAFVDAGSDEYDGQDYYVMAGYLKPEVCVEEDELDGEYDGNAVAEEPYIAESSAADVDTEEGEAHPDVEDDGEPTPSEDYPFENDTRQVQVPSLHAIVTRRFDYTTHPFILFDFYKRFAQLTDVQRGLYPNISRLNKKDGVKALNILKRFKTSYFTGERPDTYNKDLDPQQLPLLRMAFKGQVYVVPAPHFDGAMYSPFGRCTRSRAVVHLLLGEVHYFKDYWRESSPCTKESDIYGILKSAGVTFVADMYLGGDLLTGDTTTAEAVTTIGHEHISEPWVQNPNKLAIRELTAHFILLSTIGRDLATFSTARQLVTCIADAMDAHQQAYRLGILHRDISAGNILMSLEPENRHGILVDWDHCILLNSDTKDRTGTRIHRTGTWQFMSAHLTLYPETASHTVIDDRESALHVLTYMALKHLRHDLPEQRLRGTLSIFDDYIAQEGKPDMGLASKQTMIERGGPPKVKFAEPIRAMKHLIKELSEFFAPRYNEDYLSDDDDDDGRSCEELARRQKAKVEYLKRLEKLQDPESDMVYATLRKYAAKLTEPPQDITQWVDNLKPQNASKHTLEGREMSIRQKKMLGLDGLMKFSVTSYHSK
ncbi:hypothetical protein PC9H_004402 [Pleurotus ostreatus]|uniref:Fungal-type protein kinase domain-containing protein n=1 Tax=Pleurotus ostreatus TaxID=5322 RepID=A0A8H7A060_PLEOS|nr:uncharacterized protein PC9H_004402 [Pleurotus ostreatus]KAF7437560.1 hypothetical protein PC9H_004402 [Pleurotus ostreatus]KAJ8703516.1 hypothetical protein PTI98_002134 [Pleurotus ostreatus]